MDNFFANAYAEENPIEDVQAPETEEIANEEQEVTEPEGHTDESLGDNKPEVNEPEVTVPQTINIDGQEISLDELKRGYMRQSDYTKKTQEIARQRKEFDDMRTASHQMQQPHTQTQQYINPMEQRLAELEQKLADQELDNMITSMKGKYSDFDEVKVLNYAYEKGITDLDLAYKATREEKVVDVESMKSEMARQIRAEIMQELESNKTATSTIIGNGNQAVQNNAPKLSEREILLAEEFGLTPEEYEKYK